ncbi:gastrula zinc finger protein XlCGF66.1-like [Bombina bombina]|uniref:gastrula zinc finger protein XlCGF66.1-like n=1 Tax=Bombina bombina TaxID=8345 RepID=UPI00235A6C2D|nr:gastrula zinc finger protein XlCGF66.1-like [Bombina bombina]
MNKHRKQMAEQFLSQALGIICLLTGEEYAIVKKRPSHSSIHRQSGEVPIKCDDVAMHFTMEEWEFIEGHKELYKDVMMETHQALRTMEIPGNESSGHSDEHLDTGAAELVQNIQPVETPSDVIAELTGYSDENLDTGAHGDLVQNIQPSDVSADDINTDVFMKTEDLSVTCQLEVLVKEICYSDNEELTGHSDENLDTGAQGELVQNIQPVKTSSDVSAELTGHSDENLDTGAHGELVENIQPVETPSDVTAELTGYSDENLDTGAHREFVQNIQPSDVSANENDAKISCNMEQTEDQLLRNVEPSEQEICGNISAGLCEGEDLSSRVRCLAVGH